MSALMPRAPKADRKLSAAKLRQLARGHTETAVRVLAEVATNGKSEASRISAAMALLDRGYGKSGAGLALDGAPPPPILYHWIELVDGTKDKSSASHSATHDHQTCHDQD